MAQALPTQGSLSFIPKPANLKLFSKFLSLPAALSILKVSIETSRKLYSRKNSGMFFVCEGYSTSPGANAVNIPAASRSLKVPASSVPVFTDNKAIAIKFFIGHTAAR